MKAILLSIGRDSTSEYAYLRTRTALAKLSVADQKRFLEKAATEIETAIRRLDAVSQALSGTQA